METEVKLEHITKFLNFISEQTYESYGVSFEIRNNNKVIVYQSHGLKDYKDKVGKLCLKTGDVIIGNRGYYRKYNKKVWEL